MSTFELAIPVILKHEGGWVNNPADPGGETNFGISMLMVKREGMTPAQLGIPDFNPGSMKLMKVEAAKDIYRKLFWDKPGYDRINDQLVATKIFDCAVNCGPGRAHKMAQKAANRLGAGLGVDGNLGPLSIAAINACDPAQFLQAMAAEMLLYYQGIVAKNPSLGVFLKNWTHRAAWIG
jgi:lysozyme family protein